MFGAGLFAYHNKHLRDILHKISRSLFLQLNEKIKDKPLDLSSLVRDCIEISKPFLKDFEVVILFVEWIDEKVPNYR